MQLRYAVALELHRLPHEMDSVPAIELVKLAIFFKVREANRKNYQMMEQVERAGDERKQQDAGLSRNVIGRKPDPDEQ